MSMDDYEFNTTINISTMVGTPEGIKDLAEKVGAQIAQDVQAARRGNVVEAAGTARLSAPLLQFKKLKDWAKVPTRAHATDAGFDLSACITADMTIRPGARAMVPTGLAVAIPDGYVGLVAPRSGLAAKHGITITNSPGIVDSGYRGEIMSIIHNLGTEDFVVKHGDRVAQLVVTPFLPAVGVEVDELPEADRGDAGFGSTGA